MLNMDKKLLELADKKKEIKCSIIGCGLQGGTIVAEMLGITAMRPSIACDIDLERAKNAYLKNGVAEDEIYEAKSVEEANELVRKGKFVITDNSDIAATCGYLDVVIEATGVPFIAPDIIMKAIYQKKHVVTMSAEAETVIGPILKMKADEAGVIYTVGAGDEPAACMELYSLARTMNVDIWCMGKAICNPFIPDSTPDFCREEAIRRRLNPHILTEFQDGSKTRIEMAQLSNATGLPIDVRHLHQPEGITRNQLVDVFKLKKDGGILNNLGVVEAVEGPDVAPGVFCIVAPKNDEVTYQMQFLNMGTGPSFLLFRPFHMCCLEVPLSAARAVIYNEPSIVTPGNLISENIAIAKKDLFAGEMLDALGGFCWRASVEHYSIARESNFVPMGLISTKTKMKRNVKKGEILTYDDVELDQESTTYKLRMEQEAFFHG